MKRNLTQRKHAAWWKGILSIKRVIPLAAAILILVSSPLEIIAAEKMTTEGTLTEASMLMEQTDDSQTDDSQTGTSQVKVNPTITLDSEHVYEGMTSSFSKGYMPKVTDSSVRVVIPYLANCSLRDNMLTVKADVSSAVACGVTAKSYIKKVKLKNCKVSSANGSSGENSAQVKNGQKENTGKENIGEVKAYLYDCKFSLDKERQGGTGPIVLTASGITEDGQEISFSYTVFAVLSKTVSAEESDNNNSNSNNSDNHSQENNNGDPSNIGEEGGASDNHGEEGDDNNAGGSDDNSVEGEGFDDNSSGGGSEGSSSGGEPAGETKQEVIHQPKIILESCNLSSEKLEAGKSYAVSAIFKNCNNKRAISNMKVTLSMESSSIQIQKYSLYIDSVKAGGSFTVQSKIEVASITDQGNYPIQVNFEYDDVDGNSYTTAETIPLTVKQPLNVNMDEVAIPQEVYSTDTISLPVSVINLSRAPLYNVMISLECDGLVPVQSVFLGNMEAGTQAADEMRVYVGSRIEGQKYGETAGVMKLSYQDAYGETNEQTINMSTTILEPEILQLNVEQAQPETNGWMGMILTVAFVILTGIIIYLVIRLKKSGNGAGV